MLHSDLDLYFYRDVEVLQQRAVELLEGLENESEQQRLREPGGSRRRWSHPPWKCLRSVWIWR